MSKRFEHLDDEWVATATGTGVGSGAFGNALPPITRWGVVFRSMKNPEREYRGSLSGADPANVPEAELRSVLEEQLVLAAINRSKYVWRPADAIARETKIPLDRVQSALDGLDSIIEGDQNAEGLQLYTTREHLSRTSGDVMKEFFEVRRSS